MSVLKVEMDTKTGNIFKYVLKTIIFTQIALRHWANVGPIVALHWHNVGSHRWPNAVLSAGPALGQCCTKKFLSLKIMM